MFKVAIPLPRNGNYQMQWDYILSSFPCDELIVIGDEADAPNTNAFAKLNATYVDDLSAVIDTLILLAPDNGKVFQGGEDLTTFQHPTDAMYFFGGDVDWVDEAQIGREPDHKVFIPTATHDNLWSWQAYAITAWDRRMKSG